MASSEADTKHGTRQIEGAFTTKCTRLNTQLTPYGMQKVSNSDCMIDELAGLLSHRNVSYICNIWSHKLSRNLADVQPA